MTLIGVTVDQLNASNVTFVGYNMTEPASAVAAVTAGGPAAGGPIYEMSIA